MGKKPARFFLKLKNRLEFKTLSNNATLLHTYLLIRPCLLVFLNKTESEDKRIAVSFLFYDVYR